MSRHQPPMHCTRVGGSCPAVEWFTTFLWEEESVLLEAGFQSSQLPHFSGGRLPTYAWAHCCLTLTDGTGMEPSCLGSGAEHWRPGPRYINPWWITLRSGTEIARAARATARNQRRKHAPYSDPEERRIQVKNIYPEITGGRRGSAPAWGLRSPQ